MQNNLCLVECLQILKIFKLMSIICQASLWHIVVRHLCQLHHQAKSAWPGNKSKNKFQVSISKQSELLTILPYPTSQLIILLHSYRIPGQCFTIHYWFLWLYDSIWCRQLVVPSISSFIYGEFYQLHICLNTHCDLIPSITHHENTTSFPPHSVWLDSCLPLMNKLPVLKLEITLNLEQS